MRLARAAIDVPITARHHLLSNAVNSTHPQCHTSVTSQRATD